MSVERSVLEAMAAAVAAAPEDTALRCHLADLLLTDGQPDRALDEARTVLVAEPANLAALRVAAASATALGNPSAAGYGQLLGALDDPGAGTGTAAPTAASDRPRPSTPGSGIEVPDTADALIEGWADVDVPEVPDIGSLGRPTLTFADVAGMDEVKARLDLSFLAPLRRPDLSMAFGKSLRGGLLLWGPPGCGKTYLARAAAGELGASFYEVRLSDVLDMWIGSSERNVHSIFEVARRNRPCMLFFDEVDAIGQRRTQLRGAGSSMRGVVNQLLAELDGAGSDNEGVFVLAATNHPWDIDTALLRPGRFDRRMLVLPPDLDARVGVLTKHLAGRPTASLDLRKVAQRTDGYTGADLALVCEQAAESALEASTRRGEVVPISQRDLLAAVKEIRPSISGWIETARNYAIYNNDGGQYDDLLEFIANRR